MSNASPALVPVTSGAAPIRLLPMFVERIWGTTSLDPFFPATETLVGEVWLTAAECAVEGSTSTLGELAEANPQAYANANGTGFPLLVKMLFPREKLSVQVHPDDAYAQAKLGEPRGKTECWYVLSAEPGAEVAVGFREPLDTEAVRSAIANGSLESHLRMLPVQAGDMVFIDAGTVHAIGPGAVLLETQQYSDVTYRLWDYGRPRQLHVDEGLAVMRSTTEAGFVEPVLTNGFERLVSCAYFTVDRFRLHAGLEVPLESEGKLQILVAIGAGARLHDAKGKVQPLAPAHAVLLPANAGSARVSAHDDLEVIRIMPGSDAV